MFKVKVTGLAGLKAEFATLSSDLPKIVSSELQTMAQEWVLLAKKDSPADQATLRGGISFSQRDKLVYDIFSNAFYSPFMEFGTKGKYQPIPGTEKIAAEFKGYKGGDFMELLRNIVRWVKRKGITGTYSVKTRKRRGSKINQIAEDYSAAWPIAMSILKNGVNPHPFFFKQMHIVWPQMVRNVERRIAERSKVKVIMPNNIQPKIVTI
jgi:hypothetical protein